MSKWYLIGSLFLFLGCKNSKTEEPITSEEERSFVLEIPTGFPEMPIPEDNLLTEARVALGKKMFYDPIFSRDSSLACATCHNPEKAFADNLPTTPGIENRPGTRNVPSLGNVGYQPYLLREGSVPSIEMQVLVPIQEENEFNHNIVDLYEQMKVIPTYVEMSLEAYGRVPDAFVISRALGAFERTLISGNSRYDQYKYQGKQSALSLEEIKGMNLFFSDSLACGTCHGGFNFSNYVFTNTGLYENYPDPGRYRLTLDSNDLAVFKVPSLRNVAVTYPYMHDGSLGTLEEAVDQHLSGGYNHRNKSPLIQKHQLSEEERQQLLSFLHTLTDDSFITNEAYLPDEN